jgi:hypothetical protein
MRARSRRAGALIPLLVAGLVLIGMGSTAGAQSARRLEFHLHADHGYRVQVQASPATATLTATRAKHDSKTGSLSSYIARREPGDGAIRATFGALGTIAMRFRPNGAVTYSKPQAGCVGADRYTIHHGVFVGSLRFRGEGDYVSVKAQRVAGVSVAPLSLDCSGSPATGRTLSAAADRPPVFRFEAGFRSGTLAEFFYASEEGAHPARFVASVEQTVGRLAIHRLAIARGGPRSFATDDALSFATISPTSPFAGTGSMTRGPTGARLWGGSLTVTFPGAPEVPLTGPPFKTRLSRSL